MSSRGEVKRKQGAKVAGLYGYVRVQNGQPAHWTADPERAAVVRRIFAERANEASYEAIAAGLNRDGIPGPRGRLWTQSTIGGLLGNSAYVGQPRSRLGARRSQRDYEPIIGEATFRRVQELVTSSARMQRKTGDLDGLAVRLRLRRAALGLTQTEVAERAGVTPSTISRVESGLRYPEPQVLYAIAGALESSVLDLLSGTPGESADGEALVTRFLPSSPIHRELRAALNSIEHGFSGLKPSERHLTLAILKVLATRADVARQL